MPKQASMGFTVEVSAMSNTIASVATGTAHTARASIATRAAQAPGIHDPRIGDAKRYGRWRHICPGREGSQHNQTVHSGVYLWGVRIRCGVKCL